MIIIRNIADFIIYSEDEVGNAIRKIEKNKSGLVFLVNHHGELDGVFTRCNIYRKPNQSSSK